MNVSSAGSQPSQVPLPRPLHVFQRLTGTAHYHFGYFDDGPQDLDRALDRLALLDTEHCDPCAPVLDAGCGMGGTTVQLADRGFQVVGIDPFLQLIQFARAQTRPGAPVRYHASRLEDFAPTSAGAFGSILMIEVSQHFGCLGQALTLAASVLRRGGRVLVKDVFTGRRHPRERVPYHAHTDINAAVAQARLGVVHRRDITANVVGTLPLLRARILRARNESVSTSAEPSLRTDLCELDAGLAVLADAFQAGDIAYESLLLERSG